MIAIDTTLLVDLYWQDSPRHKRAVDFYNHLATETEEEILIYYNCFNEFIHVITDTKRFENAFSMKEALAVVEEWRWLERVKIIFPDEDCFCRTQAWLDIYDLGRKRINDTNMASCYALNAVSKIYTANPKDFEGYETFEVLEY